MKGAIVFLAVVAMAYSSAVVKQPECTLPGEDDQVVLLPNPDDCSTFFTCLGLTPVLTPCMPGLWFNPLYNVCDFPQNIPEGVCKPPQKRD